MKELREDTQPWYRYRWPWILISIPLLTVIASFYTFYLAVTHPDYLVVDDEKYDEIRSELRAQEIKPESVEDDGQP